MSFLDLTPQQQTGLQVKSWLDSLHANIDSAKSNYDNIGNWMAVASENPEYTQEDFEAVSARLFEAVEKIKSLLPKE